jgi:hypothetical protein
MAALFEGEFMGRIANPEIGGSPVKVKFDVIVTSDGPHKGKRAQYSGKFDDKNVKWTKRDMVLAGWQGKNSRTFIEDVKKAAREVSFTAEIASYKRDDGSISEWTSAKLGGGAPLTPPDAEGYDKLDRWLNEAGDVEPQKKADADNPF